MLSMLSGCTTAFSNVSRGVQPLSMLSGCTTLSMLSECTSFINIIRVYNLYQYYQRSTTTIINISRDVQPLSILAGVYTLYQCCQGVQQPLAMLVGCTILSILSRVYNLYQCYQDVKPLSILLGCTTFINIIRGGYYLPHIPLIKVISNPNGIEISNKHVITHLCNYILTLLHTPGVINKSDYSCLMTLMNMIAHIWVFIFHVNSHPLTVHIIWQFTSSDSSHPLTVLFW